MTKPSVWTICPNPSAEISPVRHMAEKAYAFSPGYRYHTINAMHEWYPTPSRLRRLPCSQSVGDRIKYHRCLWLLYYRFVQFATSCHRICHLFYKSGCHTCSNKHRHSLTRRQPAVKTNFSTSWPNAKSPPSSAPKAKVTRPPRPLRRSAKANIAAPASDCRGRA